MSFFLSLPVENVMISVILFHAKIKRWLWLWLDRLWRRLNLAKFGNGCRVGRAEFVLLHQPAVERITCRQPRERGKRNSSRSDMLMTRRGHYEPKRRRDYRDCRESIFKISLNERNEGGWQRVIHILPRYLPMSTSVDDSTRAKNSDTNTQETEKEWQLEKTLVNCFIDPFQSTPSVSRPIPRLAVAIPPDLKYSSSILFITKSAFIYLITCTKYLYWLTWCHIG